jgi:hypothetical protein
MTWLKLLSAALIASTALATSALARESTASSRHTSKGTEASIARGVDRTFQGDISRGYEGHDVWGHWGAYYGPMIPSVP